MLAAFVTFATALYAPLDQTPPQYAFPAREYRQKGAADHVAIATGDIDNDGLYDVVSTTANAWLKVMRGSWGLGLKAAGTVPTAGVVHALALGDLDGDGGQDLTFLVGDHVYVALGNGSGVFATPQTIGSLKGAVAVRAAQVDGDARLDVCVLSQLTGRVKVFLSAPGGGFLPPVSSIVASAPTDFEFEDLDGFEGIDLAVADAGASAVVIAKGLGNGKFTVLHSYPATQGSPTAIAIGDLDGDLILDIATASAYAFVLQQRLGAGDGTFGALATCGVGQDIELADWNGDGLTDRLALSGGVVVYTGGGDCGFQDPRRLPVSKSVTSLAVLNANGDLHLDLAFGAASDVDEPTGTGDTFTSVGVVHGSGPDGVLGVVGVPGDPLLPPAQFTQAIDLDGDGIVDVLGTLPHESAVVVRRGTGDVSFAASEVIAIDGDADFVHPAPADLDGDGDLDLVVASELGVHTVLSTGSAFLPARQVLTLSVGSIMRVADLNADGWDDVFFVTPAGALTFLSRGNGHLVGPLISPEVEFPGLAPLAIEPADLDGDAHPDLVVAGWHQGLRTYFGTGNGTFVPAGFVPAEPNWSHTVVGDLDGDGLDDVLVANMNWKCFCNPRTVVSLLSDGQGGLAVHGEYEVGRGIMHLGLHDLNGDGALDLHAWLGQGVLAIADGEGTGGFGVARRYGSSGIPIGAGFTWKGLPPLYADLLPDLVVSPVDDQGGAIDLEIVIQH